ncbi:hypothetical protein DM05_3605 [Pseudomonas poae]|uniref:Uncharacterized protein n=1 Tax=Pseudomonas poae TaxID=200451 RepID=A0A7Z1GLY5_9PSED|nr:hypothetical protein DM05_3605 [Pseudomonas poae]
MQAGRPYRGQAPSHTLIREYIQMWEGACPDSGLKDYEYLRACAGSIFAARYAG